jgi:voltage-gated potassium channel
VRTHEVIFGAETPAGKLFDICLVICILASTATTMLESVASIREVHGDLLFKLDWFFAFLFAIEYGLRLAVVRHPARYARSFFGIVDLMAFLPTFISPFFAGIRFLTTVRILRVLRIFRILKVLPLVRESEFLWGAIWASRGKILVF